MASTVMSPLLGSLFLVAMLSAIMSTVNSILLVTGGAFAHDLYKRLVNPAGHRSGGWSGSTACRSSCSGIVPFWFATLQARRRAGDRRRAGEVHRQLLLRAGGARAELAARDARKARSGAWWRASSGAWSGRSRCSAASRPTASTRWKSAWSLSALTFILVSRATPPTPAENLAIFFDEADGSSCVRVLRFEVRGSRTSMSMMINVFKDEALEAAAREAIRLDEPRALLDGS